MDSDWHDRQIEDSDGQSIFRSETSTSEGSDDSAGGSEHPVAAKIRQSLFPEGANTSEQFLPNCQLERVLSIEDINSVLKHRTTGKHRFTEAIDVERDVCPPGGDSKRIKILTVLILIERPGHITKFIDNKVWDTDLPLPPEHSIFKALKNGYFTDQFCQWQWVVLAPVLDFTAMRHLVLEPQVRMPFLDRPVFSKSREGAHGRVSRISIHDHHQIRRKSLTQDSYPDYAIKLFKLEDNEDNFENERDALARFSGPGKTHPNLIELLFSYERGSEKYLIFPWAKCDLEQFWESEKRDLPSAENFTWLLQQCLGLAEGLCKVHVHYTDKHGHNGGVQGRHGDIKPQNILFFEGSQAEQSRFVLADFTLMRFHAPDAVITDAKSLKRMTQTYRPPEVEGEAGISATHKYDIWTLGCVYLEFVTWHLLGYDAIRKKSFRNPDGEYESFSTARLSDDDKRYDGLAKDKFFNFVDKSKAKAKGSVQEWIAFLKGHQHASPALRTFLDVVSTRMLVPNPDNRCNTEKLVKKLRTILFECRERATYSQPGYRNPQEIIPHTCFPRPFTKDSQYGVMGNAPPQDVNNVLDSPSKSDMDLIEAEFLGSGSATHYSHTGNESSRHNGKENQNELATEVTSPAGTIPAGLRIGGPRRPTLSLRTFLVQADPRLETLSQQVTTPDSNDVAIPTDLLFGTIGQRSHGAALEHETNMNQGIDGQHNRRLWFKLKESGRMMGQRGKRLFSSGIKHLEAWKKKAGDKYKRLSDRITT